MQIDWITVAAQIVNFLVLVWLLHRFLYGPVVKAMESREQRIAARLSEAEKREREAEHEAAEYRARQAELEHEKGRILAMAEEEADTTRRSLEEAVRQEAERLRKELADEIGNEKEAFIRDMRRRSAEHVLELARRVLSELSDSKLEEQMAAAFARQIQSIDADVRDRLVKASHDAGGKIVVRARVTLGADGRRQITRAVHESLSGAAEVNYEQNEDTTSGLELKAGSEVLTWTFASYLDELEQQLHKDLAEIGSRGEDASAA